MSRAYIAVAARDEPELAGSGDQGIDDDGSTVVVALHGLVQQPLEFA